MPEQTPSIEDIKGHGTREDIGRRCDNEHAPPTPGPGGGMLETEDMFVYWNLALSSPKTDAKGETAEKKKTQKRKKRGIRVKSSPEEGASHCVRRKT